MKYKEFNEKIIQYVGGKENIQAVVHCMTRLRFTLKDPKLAKSEDIKAMDGVIDVVNNKVSYQIIIGTHVNDVHAELLSMLGMDDINEVKTKKNVIKGILDLLSESMTPILEPMMAAGLIAGILAIVSSLGFMSAESSTYIILDTIRSAVFYFLPVLMAMSCAKRLHASPFLAATLACILVSNSINGIEGLTFFGLDVPVITYSGSFFPIILATWFMGILQKYVKKWLPSFLHFFFVPLIILGICLPVTLFLFGPIGTWIGNIISIVCDFLMNTLGNWSVVALYAAIQPFLIMMGAGNFVMPVAMNFLATLGYDPIFVAGGLISDTAVAGAMIGYFLKTKDSKQRQLFGAAGFSALLCCTEPAVFGAFVKYRRPFIAVMIGGGLGGLFAGIMNVKAYIMTGGILALPTFIGNQDMRNFYCIAIAVSIAFIVSAVVAYLLGIPSENNNIEKKEIINKKENLMEKVNLYLPVKGETIELEAIDDKAFSSGALGKGCAIIPSDNQLYSPVTGVISCVFPTKHAIGITSDEGIEILLHIGIDTVELQGKYFDIKVHQGEHIEIGQLLGVIEFEAIKKEGYDPTVIMVVTNSADYLDVVTNKYVEDEKNDNCLTVIL